MALPFRKGKTAQARTHAGSSLRLDIILGQGIAIITGMSHLVLVLTAVSLIVHVQLARRRHQ